MVMMDLETKSLWSHLLGTAMRGELIESRLTPLPSLLTDWETWKSLHPDTTVMLLDPVASEFARHLYSNLQMFVVGLATPDNSKAWGFDELSKTPLLNDTFAGQPIVIHFDADSGTPFTFKRHSDDKELSFVEENGLFIDEQTRSHWDLTKGVAISGELKDSKLQKMPATTSFRQAWKIFYPETEFWNPAEN